MVPTLEQYLGIRGEVQVSLGSPRPSALWEGQRPTEAMPTRLFPTSGNGTQELGPGAWAWSA